MLDFSPTADRVAAWLGLQRWAARPAEDDQAGATPRFLVSSRTAGERPLAETLGLAAQFGYAGVEVWSADLARDNQPPRKLGRMAESLGLTLLCHAHTTHANIATRNTRRWRRAMTLLRDCLYEAAELGASLCVVHPGKMPSADRDPERYWPTMIESLAWLADQAARLDLVVGVEQMEPGRSFLCGPNDIRRLFRAVPSEHLQLTLDLNHAAAWCRDGRLTLTEFTRQAERLAHVHISDGSPLRRHLPLGEGGLDVGAMLEALQESGYRGTVTIEGRAEGRELAVIESNRRYLRAWSTVSLNRQAPLAV
jgi:sugar phosphate isomerase/epimerase